jgi:hypothetical protein
MSATKAVFRSALQHHQSVIPRRPSPKNGTPTTFIVLIILSCSFLNFSCVFSDVMYHVWCLSRAVMCENRTVEGFSMEIVTGDGNFQNFHFNFQGI